MKTEARFACPSALLTLRALLRRTRGLLWAFLAASVALHLCLVQLRVAAVRDRAARPLTTQFVNRQPRLTKPLELKKRPRPKRLQLRREMVSVRAQVHREAAPVAIASEVARNLAKPSRPMGRDVLVAGVVSEPRAVAERIVGSREPTDRIAMSLELMDVEALDTGRYQAMVIQDPNDKRSIKGYVHLTIAYPFSLEQYYRESWPATMSGLRNLVGKLNEWTEIRASVAGQVSFDSAEFLRTPWTYLSVDVSMEPTESEAQSLGKYLLGGGFFYFEGMNFRDYQGQRYLMHFLESALQSQGYRRGIDWEYQLLPGSHPIFHCYYELPDGPPAGHTLEMYGRSGRERNDGLEPWARGVYIDGHMSALNTNQGYGLPWCAWGRTSAPLWADERRVGYSPTLQFRWGINTIIFALTQEGSITRRLMDSIR